MAAFRCPRSVKDQADLSAASRVLKALDMVWLSVLYAPKIAVSLLLTKFCMQAKSMFFFGAAWAAAVPDTKARAANAITNFFM